MALLRHPGKIGGGVLDCGGVLPTPQPGCWYAPHFREPTRRKAASSSEPFLNGVTKAVNEPRNFVLAAMGFLQTLKKRHDRNWISIHIGSGDQAKGLCRTALALCFNALSWQLGPAPSSARRQPRFCRGDGANRSGRDVLAFCPHIQSNRPKAGPIE